MKNQFFYSIIATFFLWPLGKQYIPWGFHQPPLVSYLLVRKKINDLGVISTSWRHSHWSSQRPFNKTNNTHILSVEKGQLAHQDINPIETLGGER